MFILQVEEGQRELHVFTSEHFILEPVGDL